MSAPTSASAGGCVETRFDRARICLSRFNANLDFEIFLRILFFGADKQRLSGVDRLDQSLNPYDV